MKNLNVVNVVAGLICCLVSTQSQNAIAQKKAQIDGRNQSVVGKSDSIILYTKQEVDNAIKVNLDKAMKANANYANAQLGMSKENAPYLVVARTKPGLVEIHEAWDDVAVIRSGHGILITGYQATGDKKVTNEEPQREWRGGVIQNGKERNLAPGDFIIIPAMVAHQYIPNSGDTLTYWTIKVNGQKTK
jgi:mannose-6-phosphate isomerase-like protein (cupin superfamily)